MYRLWLYCNGIWSQHRNNPHHEFASAQEAKHRVININGEATAWVIINERDRSFEEAGGDPIALVRADPMGFRSY